jgi:hypothetical protein
VFTSPEAAEASGFAAEGVAVLDNRQDVIDSIPKLQRDETNLEDRVKEGNELFLDVCESFRYGVMSYGREQGTPKEVLLQRKIQAIPSNTEKYIRWLQLTSRPPTADIVFTIPRRRWIPGASVVTSPKDSCFSRSVLLV